MDAPPGKDDAGSALVKSNLAHGTILLTGPDGDVTLVWKDGEKGKARALPPGSYRLRTIRVERVQDGTHWFLSSTGPKGKPMDLAGRRTKRVDVTDTVHFRHQINPDPKSGGLNLGFSIKTADDRGLSIYKDGRRVPVRYEVLAKGGAVLAQGTMKYG